MNEKNLGDVVATRGVHEAMASNDRFYDFVSSSLFNRYLNEDWGEMCEEDKAMNDATCKLPCGDRILASYDVPKDIDADGHDKIWIITEWDRSVTTILFPEEY